MVCLYQADSKNTIYFANIRILYTKDIGTKKLPSEYERQLYIV